MDEYTVSNRIQGIPGGIVQKLFTIPPGVKPEHHRVFVCYQLAAFMAIGYDLLFPPVFLALGLHWLAAAKVISLIIWIAALVMLRKGHTIGAVVLACTELFYHSLCGVVMLGWEYGFQWYSLAVPLNIALLPKQHRSVRMVLFAVSALMIPALYLAWKAVPALYSCPSWFTFAMVASNWVILALVIAINTAYYRIIAEHLDQENTSALGKAENLLMNILPKTIITELSGNYEDNEHRHSVVNDYRETSVMFCDIVNFSGMTKSIPPQHLISMLDSLFSRIDDLCDRFKLEKIKTIGDAYMLSGGCPNSMTDHAARTVECGFAILDLVREFNKAGTSNLALRIGIHSGPVIAGIIGKRKFSFDLWGETVNIASRLESSGIPGRIHISQATCDLIKQEYSCESRGTMELKGQAPMQTWLVMENDQQKLSGEP